MSLTVLVASENSTVVSYIWNTVNTTVQTDLEATSQVSDQPNSASGTTHPGDIGRICRHPVTPFR